MAEGSGKEGDGAGSGDGGFQPITSQDDLNRIIDDRLKRERAKYADYAELKDKAKAYDKLQQDSQTAEQALNDRLAKLESSLTDQQVANLRLKVAQRHKLPDGSEEFLTGTTEDTLDEQAKRLLGLGTGIATNGGVVSKEGSTETKGAPDPKREWLASLNQE